MVWQSNRWRNQICHFGPSKDSDYHGKSHSSNEGAIIQLDEAGWTTEDVAGR